MTQQQNPFADPSTLTIHFAHVAYQLKQRFTARETPYGFFQTGDPDETRDRISDADVFVVSGLWDNSLLEVAGKLKYIQSIGAGYDQFPLDELVAAGVDMRSPTPVAQAIAHFGRLVDALQETYRAL